MGQKSAPQLLDNIYWYFNCITTKEGMYIFLKACIKDAESCW